MRIFSCILSFFCCHKKSCASVLLSTFLLVFLLFPAASFAKASEAVSVGETSSPSLDAVLVLDVSGSMIDSDPQYKSCEAALSLTGTLASLDRARTAIITFSDQIGLCTPFMDLHTEAGLHTVTNYLESLSYTHGDTDIGQALEKAKDMLLSEEASGQARCIVLLTDGEIDLPRASDEKAAENESLTRALVAIEECVENEIVIHSVMLDPSGDLDPHLCSYMADKTGGTSARTSLSSDLPGLFTTIGSCAVRQAEECARRQMEQTKAMQEETQPETETEAAAQEMVETEPETETEDKAVILQTGSIDDPVLLRGLLPDRCSASLSLQDLFSSSAAVKYTAYASDPEILQCSIEGGSLLLKGAGKGMTTVTVYAQPLGDVPYTGGGPVVFDVQVRSVFSSVRIPALIAGALLLFTALLAALKRTGRPALSGSFKWYVLPEESRIFGVPSMTLAALEPYGKKVYLSELVDDAYLADARLSGVVLSARRDGVRIASRSKDITLQDESGEAQRSLLLQTDAKLKIFCRTMHGTVTIHAQYSPSDRMPEYEAADAYEERTRILVPESYKKAG